MSVIKGKWVKDRRSLRLPRRDAVQQPLQLPASQQRRESFVPCGLPQQGYTGSNFVPRKLIMFSWAVEAIVLISSDFYNPASTRKCSYAFLPRLAPPDVARSGDGKCSFLSILTTALGLQTSSCLWLCQSSTRLRMRWTGARP